MANAMQATDREMILDQDSWPWWPMLPMKRKNNSLEDKNLGVLLSDKMTIYHFYMFDAPKTLVNVPKTEYTDVDALLADGWRID